MALERLFRRRRPSGENRDVPELWTKCEACGATLYKKELKENLGVCPKCGHHHRMPAAERVEMLADAGTFQETTPLKAPGPPGLRGHQALRRAAQGLPGGDGAPRRHFGRGLRHRWGCPRSSWSWTTPSPGGPWGAWWGRRSPGGWSGRRRRGGLWSSWPPLGGARMQEAALSPHADGQDGDEPGPPLGQAPPLRGHPHRPHHRGSDGELRRPGRRHLRRARGPDRASPGPGVIKQTIRQELPEGFQRSEFLLKHGMVDRVTDRRRLKGGGGPGPPPPAPGGSLWRWSLKSPSRSWKSASRTSGRPPGPRGWTWSRRSASWRSA
jgi:acetyl-CoA carboxylase carboxyl transferase subunit beta